MEHISQIRRTSKRLPDSGLFATSIHDHKSSYSFRRAVKDASGIACLNKDTIPHKCHRIPKLRFLTTIAMIGKGKTNVTTLLFCPNSQYSHFTPTSIIIPIDRSHSYQSSISNHPNTLGFAIITALIDWNWIETSPYSHH